MEGWLPPPRGEPGSRAIAERDESQKPERNRSTREHARRPEGPRVLHSRSPSPCGGRRPDCRVRSGRGDPSCNLDLPGFSGVRRAKPGKGGRHDVAGNLSRGPGGYESRPVEVGLALVGRQGVGVADCRAGAEETHANRPQNHTDHRRLPRRQRGRHLRNSSASAARRRVNPRSPCLWT